MKIFASVLALALSASAWADPVASTTLMARAQSGQPDNYADACFSFTSMTHDQNVTGNDYDLEYDGASLGGIQVVDNLSSIADLGAMSCKDVSNSYEQSGPYPGKGHGGYPFKEDRQKSPMFWLEYSDAMTKLQDGPTTSSITPQAGHCYIINKVTSGRRVLAMFHVSDVQPGKWVSLDQIEVFDRSSLIQSMDPNQAVSGLKSAPAGANVELDAGVVKNASAAATGANASASAKSAGVQAAK